MLNNGLARRDKHDLAIGDGRDERRRDAGPAQRRAHADAASSCWAAPAPSPRAARMLEHLQEWRAGGSSRLDRDLDGVMDAGPGPAIMDAFYPRLFNAVMPGRASRR